MLVFYICILYLLDKLLLPIPAKYFIQCHSQQHWGEIILDFHLLFNVTKVQYLWQYLIKKSTTKLKNNFQKKLHGAWKRSQNKYNKTLTIPRKSNTHLFIGSQIVNSDIGFCYFIFCFLGKKKNQKIKLLFWFTLFLFLWI